MTPDRTVVLDNEAVQALANPRHRKHRRMMAVVEAVAARNLRRSGSVHLVVPTTVRVEAGWNRQNSTAGAVNWLRIADHPLDAATADRAADIRSALGISVADAHLAATLAGTDGPHTVVTSDTDDVRRIGKHLGIPVNAVGV